MVRLGARVDSPSRLADVALRTWQQQFMRLWNDLLCDCLGVQHHEKRIRQIERKLADPELLIRLPEGSPERIRAQESLEQHRDGLAARTARINGLTWNVGEFWRGRPEAADQWLLTEWFPGGVRPDPVVSAMVARSKEVAWLEMFKLCERSGEPANTDSVPF